MNFKTLEQTRVARTMPTLSCVWITTGNPRQPLACVWVENDVLGALGATGTDDQAPAGEDHLVGLAA